MHPPSEPGSPESLPAGPANRLATIMVHIPWYTFSGQKRLAEDVSVSRSTISRLVSGKARPSLALAQRIAHTLSERLDITLTVDDVFSPDGTFREPSGCRLCRCTGCFPDDAYDHRGNLKLAFRNMRPGDWSDASLRQSANTAP